MGLSNIIAHLRKLKMLNFPTTDPPSVFSMPEADLRRIFLGSLSSYYYITCSDNTRLQEKVLEKLLCDNLFHVCTMDICIHIHPSLDGHSNRYGI